MYIPTYLGRDIHKNVKYLLNIPSYNTYIYLNIFLLTYILFLLLFFYYFLLSLLWLYLLLNL